MSVRVVRVETPEQRAAMTAIRMAVFVQEQNVAPEREMDAFDDDMRALHGVLARAHRWSARRQSPENSSG